MPEIIKTPKNKEEAMKLKKTGQMVAGIGAVILVIVIAITAGGGGAPNILILAAGVMLALGIMQIVKANKHLK